MDAPIFYLDVPSEVIVTVTTGQQLYVFNNRDSSIHVSCRCSIFRDGTIRLSLPCESIAIITIAPDLNWRIESLNPQGGMWPIGNYKFEYEPNRLSVIGIQELIGFIGQTETSVIVTVNP